MRSLKVFAFIPIVCLTLQMPAQAAPPPKNKIVRSQNGQDLYDLASKASPERYQYAVDNGAEVRYAEDGKSFFLIWYPDKTAAQKPPVIACIHGHGSYAFDEFYLWHKTAKEHGYGIVGLQWWLGGSEKTEDYLAPREIYRAFNQVFLKEKIKPGSILFHGFSRGAAVSYAVTAMDVKTQQHFFGLIVANSGGASMDYPPNRDIEDGQFGSQPFAGTRWVMYAGGRDTNPDRDGIPGMLRSAEWVKKGGGEILKVIQDPSGGHGGLHRNPANLEQVMTIFDALVKTSPSQNSNN